MENFKSGFVTVIGRPNVGKSTLVNRIVGEKVAIVSNKPQTTRTRITAVYQDEESQIVFVDTPGVHKPRNKLGSYMVNAALTTMDDMDAVLFMVDASKNVVDEAIIKKLNQSKAATILVINKIDLVAKERVLEIIAQYNELCNFDTIVTISAQKDDGIDILMNEIKKFLPYGPKYFPDDMITDQPEKQMVGEMIREKVLRFLSDEVPHGVAVEIEGMKYEQEICRINAVIYVEKDTHKRIIIGKNGEMMKKIASSARHEIERFLGGKVYLEIWVKVKNDWRNSDFLLKNFGFEE